MSLRSRVSVAVILGGIAVAHVFAPTHVQIDWPTITLVAIALIVAFWSEITTILPYIKRFRFGDAEIEMRDEAAKLHKEVEKVEETPIAAKKRQIPGGLIIPESTKQVRKPEADILEVASRDKETALIQLAIEIEKELARLSGQTDELDRSRTIRQTLDGLVDQGLIPRDLANTILTFRDVRNKVVHPIRQIPVNDSILTSAIDSGVRILSILRSIWTF